MCLAIPGQIVSLAEDPPHGALVDVVGVRRRVDVSLVEPEGVGPGDWVLIHVGFAMSKISEQDALDQTAHAHRAGRERRPPWRKCAATARTMPIRRRSVRVHEIRR